MQTIRNIVVGYDGFERDEELPQLARRIAEQHGAQLHLVHVAPKIPRQSRTHARISAEELSGLLVENRMGRLCTLLDSPENRGLNSRAVVRIGSPHVELIKEVSAVNAELLVVADEPLGRDDHRGFGTVTTKLLRQCPCPVLATRMQLKGALRNILAAIDIDPEALDGPRPNHTIIDIGARLAKEGEGKLFAFHAWRFSGEELLRNTLHMQEPELEKLLADAYDEKLRAIEELLRESDLGELNVEVLLRKGGARQLLYQVIAEQKIDLVVMGTACRSGLKGALIGNTAERMLSQMPCSVLVVKPDDFVSPAL